MSGPNTERTPSTFGKRHGPRYRVPQETLLETSASLRAFTSHTHGLTGRLKLAGLGGMRRGSTANPFTLTRRYLVAGRQAALPKSWAQEFAVWTEGQIDSLWPMDATPLRVLEEKAMVLEAVDDRCEKRCDLERNAITLRERIQSQTAEIVADMACLAKLEREKELLEGLQ